MPLGPSGVLSFPNAGLRTTTRRRLQNDISLDNFKDTSTLRSSLDKLCTSFFFRWIGYGLCVASSSFVREIV